ncbi:MAG: ABC transporter ATP-binding protein [Chloroflexi bacterium]|nr:ABC transporter ATP-binding protein [Chloroflexota bacterium]
MAQTDSMLVVEGLRAAYGKVQALKGISLHIDAGEIISILGANGAGKTTFLRTICGLLPATGGKVVFDGQDITRVPAHRIVERGLTMVPEGRQIFGPFTVYENLEMGALIHIRRGQKKEVEDTLESIYGLFPRLYERRGQVAATLSGGEQQMLAIGRALMSRPRLLLLDEPSLGLAPMIVDSIMEALATLNRNGLTIFLVEQNAEVALSVATRAYVMEVGTVAMEGEASSLLNSDQLHVIYMGRNKPGSNRHLPAN